MKANFLLVLTGAIFLSACTGDRLDQCYAPDIPIVTHAKANGDICIYPSPKENESQIRSISVVIWMRNCLRW
ncbi:Uncharacterised protein [Serratia marcescens]|nr:hypothetical protein SN05_00482 [Serratia marcescens]CAI1720518.1 Uncharacterised protein [Serratia marcescens]CAI1779697.1 Uncharacterised protein [Serratia marcescens]CUZ20410.1 Uncharacterised protein [Serratia marcescens]CUZ38352.1 Uncharacterised protein [Serratia marcescens]